MHPWHDSYIDDDLITTAFPVVIEIPKGSKNKYELDKETGLLRLDRVLYSAVYYLPITDSFREPIAMMAIRWMCWFLLRSRSIPSPSLKHAL